MELNKVHNIDFLNNELPEKCADLIIADPPYFNVKGEFDFIWPTMHEYLIDVEKWAIECKRLLSPNGTLFWWGNSKRIAYTQVILDQYFNLENSIVWRKKDSIQYQYYSPSLARSFNTHTERLLMYSNEVDMSGLDYINETFIKPINPFSKYLREEFSKASVLNKDIAMLFPSSSGGLTGCVSNWLNGDNIITKEQYLRIREYLGGKFLRKEYDELRKEYDELRKEYDDQRRYFFNECKYEEVLEFSQEGSKTGKFDHPTMKPEKLTRALILTCSRLNDLVVVPFSGSGTECAMAAKEKRKFIGFEIDSNYAEMSNNRIREHITNVSLSLFN